KGPGGRHGSRLRAELAKKNLRLPLLGDDDEAADRNYIREFLLARDRELGRRYGVSTPRRSTTSVRGPRRGRRTTSGSTPCRCVRAPNARVAHAPRAQPERSAL